MHNSQLAAELRLEQPEVAVKEALLRLKSRSDGESTRSVRLRVKGKRDLQRYAFTRKHTFGALNYM